MISLTPSNIIEYLYCPRYIYYMYVLAIPQNEENYFKAMKGREIHERKLKQNIDYLRKSIGVVDKKLNVYLSHNHLRGIVDEVLFLEDGTAAPLDYKFAVYENKVYNTYKTQLHCYAYLIKNNFNVNVNRGFLVYVRSKNKLITEEINKKIFDKINEYIDEILEIIDENKFPKATPYKSKCLTCTYRNICPK
jgi:CRISPR-associated exonuclease Cas4